MELSTGKTKCMLMSRHQNVAPNNNIKDGLTGCVDILINFKYFERCYGMEIVFVEILKAG
jgi:hypothetical protein